MLSEKLVNLISQPIDWFWARVDPARIGKVALWYSGSVTVAALIVGLTSNPDLKAMNFWLVAMAPIILPVCAVMFVGWCVFLPVFTLVWTCEELVAWVMKVTRSNRPSDS